jgi:ribosomal protein S18 acetylase RimI-like enzyme
MTADASLHTLTEQDAASAGALLARAFCDNPGMVAMLDSDDSAVRLRVLQRVLPGFVASYVRHGTAQGVRVGERLVAVSLVLAPGHYPPSLPLQWGLTRAVAFHTRVDRALRFAVADMWMKRHHLRAPHHYLFMLGVEPECQGQGHGSVLLRALSARANADGMPCYLETDKPSSVRLYERHGYAVTHDASLPRVRRLQLWFMQRAAR